MIINSYIFQATETNLYDTANAASPVNEASATLDITATGCTITSETATGSATGSHMIKITDFPGATVVYINPPAGLAAGTYTISVDASYTKPGGTGAYFYVNAGDEWVVSEQDYFVNHDGTWETLTVTDKVYSGFVMEVQLV